jgi:hypothetical protein
VAIASASRYEKGRATRHGINSLYRLVMMFSAFYGAVYGAEKYDKPPFYTFKLYYKSFLTPTLLVNPQA